MTRSHTRSCDSKVKHDTYYGAYVALRKVKVEHNDPTLTIYSCTFCKGYHIGHSELGDRIAARVGIMAEKNSAIRRLAFLTRDKKNLERQIIYPNTILREYENLVYQIKALDEKIIRCIDIDNEAVSERLVKKYHNFCERLEDYEVLNDIDAVRLGQERLKVQIRNCEEKRWIEKAFLLFCQEELDRL